MGSLSTPMARPQNILSSLSEVLPPLTQSRPLVAPAGSNCKASPAACCPFILQFVYCLKKAVNALAEKLYSLRNNLMRADWPPGEETDADWET